MRSTALFLLIVLGAGAEQIATVTRTTSVPNPVVARMIDRLRGWTIVDSHFWVTVDGGHSWSDRSPAGPLAVPERWGVMSSGGIWSVVSYPSLGALQELLRFTSDGQAENLRLPCRAEAAAFDREGQKGLVFCRGIAGYRTVDGGHHWTQSAAPNANVSTGELEAYWTSNEHALVVAGRDFFVTADFGSSWRKSSAPTGCDASSIRFVAPGQGWLLNDAGRIFRTSDGGATWQPSSILQRSNLSPGPEEWVSFADDLHGLMVMNGRILATRDGGKTWPPLTQPGERFWAVSCAAGHCLLSSGSRIAAFTFEH